MRIASTTPTRLLGLAALLLVCAATAFAQTPAYPAKPIRLIAPAPPGGGTDYLARLIGQRLAERLGQTVVVENRSGANGNIGGEFVAHAAPDGYTLLMAYQGTMAINPSLYQTMTYDTVKDFEPVSQVVSLPFMVVVNPGTPVHTLKELVAHARANSRTLNFGSAGIGSGGHLVGETFNMTNDVKQNHIPYQGSAPAVTDLLAGRLQVMFDNAGNVGGHVRAGKLRAIGVTGTQRLPAFPDVPTAAEQGFPSMTLQAWWGVFAPRGTPAGIVGTLHSEIARILDDTAVQTQLRAAGYEPVTSRTPAQFADFVKAEVANWAKVVRASGARVD